MKYKYREGFIVEAYKVDTAKIVPTMEGSVLASSGDYVVIDGTGARRIYTPHRFNELFEKVEEE